MAAVLLAEELELCVASADAVGNQIMGGFVDGEVAQKRQPDRERIGYRPSVRSMAVFGAPMTAATIAHPMIRTVHAREGSRGLSPRGHRGMMPMMHENPFHALGNQAFARGDLGGASAYYRRALEVDRRYGSDRALAVTLGNLANVEASLGRREEAEALYRQVLELERRLGDERQIALTLLHLGNLAADALEAPRARAYYLEARDVFERLDEIGALGVLHQNMGLLARELGEHEPAVEAFDRALALMRRAGDQRGVGAVYTNLARTYHLMGRFDDAWACGATALAMAERRGDEMAVAAARYHLAGICEGRGDLRAALAHLRVVVDIDRRYGLPKYDENRARLSVLEAASEAAS